MSELFKNKNRRRVVQNVQKQAYIPEYKRMGVTPIETRPTEINEFEKNQNKIKEEEKQKSRDREKIAVLQAYRDGIISKSEAEDRLDQEVLEDIAIDRKRQKRLVSIGQGNDLVWTEDQTITTNAVYDELW